MLSNWWHPILLAWSGSLRYTRLISRCAGRALLEFLRIKEEPTLAQLTEVIDLGQFITGLAASLTNIAANMGIIFIYVIFLLLEQGNFSEKVAGLANSPEKEKRARLLIEKINKDVRTFVYQHQDADQFCHWGAELYLSQGGWGGLRGILGTADISPEFYSHYRLHRGYHLSSLITLVQFDTFTPLFPGAGGVTLIQLMMGNCLSHV